MLHNWDDVGALTLFFMLFIQNSSVHGTFFQLASELNHMVLNKHPNKFQYFPPWYPVKHIVFISCLLNSGLVSIEIIQCKSGLLVLRCYPFFCDFICHAIGVTFDGCSLLGRVTVVLNFLHLYICCITVD